ncbi:MAG: HD domain-containing phosphohydrolase, partial [Solirubrobacterales bacterium]
MAARTKTAKRKSARTRGRGKAGANGNGRKANGNGRKANGNGHRANGNGHRANGNGRSANGNGEGAAGIDRKVIAKAKSRLNGHANGNANGNGNGAATADEARRVAAEIGNALLVATSIETARHSDDVELITGALCDKLEIAGNHRDDVLAAARLHDIGKASIPREVLDKPGPLDQDEWDLMRQHTLVGEQILASVDELKEIARMVRHSHERWDGRGYPDGLSGEEIPLGSRIIFCADAFHAVRCDRPYRTGRTAGAALAEMSSCAGTQFDPRVVSSLEEVVRELRIVRPRGKSVRASRLTALLLVLAFGGSGSAVARTDLLQPTPAAPGAAPEVSAGTPLTCESAECASIFGATLLEQMRALGLVNPQQLGFPLGLTPAGLRNGSSRAGTPAQGDVGDKGARGGDGASGGAGDQGQSGGSGQGSGSSPGDSSGGQGSSGVGQGQGGGQGQGNG